MAAYDMEFSDGFMQQLEALGDLDIHAPKMIDAALPILEKAVKSGYAKHKDTGSLSESITVHHAKLNKYGYYGYVAPSGVDKDGVRNGEKGAYLEYGTSKQEATPVIIPAIRSCEAAVIAAMQEEYNKAVGN